MKNSPVGVRVPLVIVLVLTTLLEVAETVIVRRLLFLCRLDILCGLKFRNLVSHGLELPDHVRHCVVHHAEAPCEFQDNIWSGALAASGNGDGEYLLADILVWEFIGADQSQQLVALGAVLRFRCALASFVVETVLDGILDTLVKLLERSVRGNGHSTKRDGLLFVYQAVQSRVRVVGIGALDQLGKGLRVVLLDVDVNQGVVDVDHSVVNAQLEIWAHEAKNVVFLGKAEDCHWVN